MAGVIGIGASPRRKEDIRFLTGRGTYVADIQRPGMVAGVFLRSPHAHAKIKSINAKAALSMPGVLAVFHRRGSQGRSSGQPRLVDIAASEAIRAPFLASISAATSPMPDVPPVMTTVLPLISALDPCSSPLIL
jgi:hypothetical protein